MGKKFASPSKNHVEMWKVVELLAKSGAWHQWWYGNGKKIVFPKTLAQAKELVSSQAAFKEELFSKRGSRLHVDTKTVKRTNRQLKKKELKSESSRTKEKPGRGK